VVTRFIDEHRDRETAGLRWGVEPICAELSKHGCGIAPSTYYAAKTRQPSRRSARDAIVVEHVRRVHASPMIGRRLYGARKVWHELAREQARGEHLELGPVPRCQVERLMRTHGLRGVRRDKTFVTTRPDSAAVRPPDLVKRNFRAGRPNELWVVDFTYVPTWSGTVFSAFVTDVFSRRIVGWRTKATMPTELPLDALEMALWTREQAHELVDRLVHHSDAGTQTGFNRLSQRRLVAARVDAR
jgi:putative transposase